ncbi:mitochondrial inner membrane protease ATP23 homolog isoform X3 [Meleagris gallopavo]|uniref:mitochondrial inner membrane protease ATP23 homolog isoform X3 n=1 Tax=Meleagris gallopavo TaxID=9103 RepID=UPI000549B852|nr:mitochondrial inner membrane protease ATP23 homolog isoform X3 [Meleagris gallopavo]
MEDGKSTSPPGADGGEEEDDLGYRLFPDRKKEPQSFLVRSLFTFHNSTVFNDRHFSCENCDGCVSGGFDSATSQIVLCQNNIRHQSHMNRVVAHELIHAFDHCRAHVDWFKNVKHLACSEIRAANLSGDCTLMNEIARFKFGLKGHHQTCVRDRAIRSILAVRKVSRETAEKAVDEVFDACFNDLEPFGRIPHSKTDAKRAYKDFLNRDRYTANL